MEPTTFEILLVDDNPADARLIQLAFEQCPVAKTHVSVLSESRDAINYLHHTGKFTGSVTPELILLDYHMPIDGGIALSEIKGNPDFQQIPVIVLTGSQNPRDVEDIYRRHANCCFQKKNDLEDLLGLACDIAKHWLLTAMLPPKQKGYFTSPFPHKSAAE
jgi:CheY-like chemotaxis protein